MLQCHRAAVDEQGIRCLRPCIIIYDFDRIPSHGFIGLNRIPVVVIGSLVFNKIAAAGIKTQFHETFRTAVSHTLHTGQIQHASGRLCRNAVGKYYFFITIRQCIAKPRIVVGIAVVFRLIQYQHMISAYYLHSGTGFGIARIPELPSPGKSPFRCIFEILVENIILLNSRFSAPLFQSISLRCHGSCPRLLRHRSSRPRLLRHRGSRPRLLRHRGSRPRLLRHRGSRPRLLLLPRRGSRSLFLLIWRHGSRPRLLLRCRGSRFCLFFTRYHSFRLCLLRYQDSRFRNIIRLCAFLSRNLPSGTWRFLPISAYRLICILLTLLRLNGKTGFPQNTAHQTQSNQNTANLSPLSSFHLPSPLPSNTNLSPQ